nr:hypothetical protein [Legionella shakespearei]
MLSSNVWANDSLSSWYVQQADKKIVLNVELYLSTQCPYCHKADEFFRGIEANSPWLHIQRYNINEDKNALIRFNQLLTEQKMNDFAVPSVFFCGSRWVGFASAQTTGKDLLYGLNYCKQQIEQKGTLTPVTVEVLKRWANANMFDSNITGNPSALKYITTVALMDAFNPCALFCLAGFFALLFVQKSRKKQIITGLIFILVIGVVHYVQQVYASTFFELLPWLRIPAAAVGLFAFYLAGQHYRNRTIHHLFFLLSFLFAFMIQLHQQTCVMNWSFIFGQWLYNQHSAGAPTGLYQLIYQGVYLIPILLTLILYVLVSRTQFFMRLNPTLNNIGLLFIMAIALCLIIYPLALSNLALSLFVVISLILCGWLLTKFNNREV